MNADSVNADSAARRAVDIVVAGVGLAAAAPVLPALALAIRVDSPGPVIYRQVRVGRDGRPFAMLKLRTMVAHAEQVGAAVAGHRDPRVTRVGRVLRASKVDELPQLWNVLRGDMTLVGPRAEVPELLDRYGEREQQLMHQLLAVRPGLTGPGGLHFTVHQADVLDRVDDPARFHLEHQLAEKLTLELVHLERRTWRTDLVLIGRTVLVALGLRWSWLAPGPAGLTVERHPTRRDTVVPAPDDDQVIDLRGAAVPTATTAGP